MSYNCWQKEGLHFTMLGSTVTIDSRPFIVIGILRQEVTGRAQIFALEMRQLLGVYNEIANDFKSESNGRLDERSGRQLMIVGRLKPGSAATAAPWWTK